MPLYAYRCIQCGHQFEKIQKFNSEPELVCPECNGTLERPLTPPAFNFKGAGWYVNDYASRPASSSDGKPAAESARSSSADSKSESTPASESKPAATESSSKPASSSTSSAT